MHTGVMDMRVIDAGAIRVRRWRTSGDVQTLQFKKGAAQNVCPFRRQGSTLACLTVNALKTAMRKIETLSVDRFFRLNLSRTRTLMPA
jgi:hypothetical protein